MVPMLITVAICTWNRAVALDRALASMRALRAPTGVQWELVVVNNNCTDDTDLVLDRYGDALPLVRLFEPAPGQSAARNMAVRASHGDLIVWTDDDVVVPPDWLAAYARGAAAYPQAAYFGGPIRPLFEQSPPSWMDAALSTFGFLWASLDLGPRPRPLLPEEYVYGANMAFRRAALSGIAFDVGRCHVGGQLGGGDDTEVIDRLRAKGHVGMWLPDAALQHVIPADRMVPEYVIRRMYESARTNPCPTPSEAKTWGGVPRYVWRLYLTNLVKRCVLRPIRSDAWLRAAAYAAMYRGVIDGRRSAESMPGNGRSKTGVARHG